MKRLSKADLARRDELLARLAEASEAVTAAFEAVNAEIDAKITPAIEAYNAAVDEVDGWKDDIVREQDEHFDGRSEKWQDGEAGQAYASWKSEFEGLDLSHVDDATALEPPAMDHADAIAALPEEPGAS